MKFIHQSYKILLAASEKEYRLSIIHIILKDTK